MLKIVDRTKPKIIDPTEPIDVVIEIPLSKTEEYKRITESILARKIKPSIAKSKKQNPTQKKPEKTLAEVAEEIKNNRQIRTPIVVPGVSIEQYNEFHCMKKNGESMTVTPTTHAKNQFIWRYYIIDKNFKPASDEELIAKMLEVFNSGKRIAYDGYLYRNQRRKDSTSAMVWGTKKICFLIDTVTNTIITCELNGKYRKYNTAGFKAMINQGTFDHKKLQLT
jgi:hypothetical protein